jgi:hypothetical protein
MTWNARTRPAKIFVIDKVEHHLSQGDTACSIFLLQQWFDFYLCGSLLPADVEGNSQLCAQWSHGLLGMERNFIVGVLAPWRPYYRRRSRRGRHAMRSAVIKRSIIVAGHKTSVSLVTVLERIEGIGGRERCDFIRFGRHHRRR